MLHEIIHRLDEALHGLGYEADRHDVEAWSWLVFEAMTGPGRFFHTLNHIRSIWEGACPIGTLAILFHDVVYLQIDHGMTPTIRAELSRFVAEDHGGYEFRSRVAGRDRLKRIVLGIFGLSPGDRLEVGRGLNECLSALVAAQMLGSLLSEKHVAQIVTCIEATIPFRPATGDGDDTFHGLAQRLAAIDSRLGLGLGDAGVEETIELAVKVANRDVDNFAEEDPARFLDNTWRLLPEGNPALQHPSLYTVQHYRTALQATAAPLAALDPTTIFHAYRLPEVRALVERKIERAAYNLRVVNKYMSLQLLAAGILEALAELSGGNAPIALFLGDAPRPGCQPIQLEHLLASALVAAVPDDRDPVVIRLLDSGPEGQAGFDPRSSPIASLLYRGLGEQRALAAAERARLMFRGDLTPEAFLEGLDPAIVATMADATSRVASTRREPLGQIARRFGARSPSQRPPPG